MSARELDVIVVGAGIVGLTAALLLSRVVRRVTLVERADSPAEVGAGIMLQPNGLAVLEGLGLAEPVHQLGRALTAMEIRNVRGRPVSSVTIPDFGDGLDHYVAIGRRDLHATLMAAVRAEARISCVFGVSVTGATRDGTVSAADETRRADLVVGADGVSSAVRESGRFGAAISNRQTTYIRGLVADSAPDLLAEYWTPLGGFGVVPLKPDLTYFYAAAYRGEAASSLARRDLAGFRAAWRAVLPESERLLERVGTIDDLLVNGVRRVGCRTWRDGRVVLVGDAAHAMAPNLGQGANSALVDVVVLTQELATEAPTDVALARYQHRRRRVMTRLQRVAESLAWLNGLRRAGPVAVRDAAVRASGSVPGLLERQVRGAQQEEPAELLRWTASLSRAS